MSINLYNELTESFMQNSDVTPFEMSVNIKDIEKEKHDDIGIYKGTFSCSFKDFKDDSKYTISGWAYFDKDGYVYKNTDGIKSINIAIILKNYKSITSEEYRLIKPKDIH